MISDKVVIRNVKSISNLSVDFEFSNNNIIVITGRNGIGKTTLVKAFKLISEPKVFQKTTGLNVVGPNSEVTFDLEGYRSFSYTYNSILKVLDTKQAIPRHGVIVAELPIPYGERFRQFSLVAGHDAELRANIASSDYQDATELRGFLNKVYSSNKFSGLKVSKVKKHHFYFILRENDYYIREDHFSSGEFFLIQLYRLITSGAKLILIDEFDVALDASAQVNLYEPIKSLLAEYNSRLIVISHSLAFMNTVDEGGLYYLEEGREAVSLERRSFGYVKSDLYGFRGKDRYIITEDDTLVGFLNYLIKRNISAFFEYEIIAVGGQPQIKSIAEKNDSHKIFGESDQLIIVVDNDIYNIINYSGRSILLSTGVEDIELFVWKNREKLLADVNISPFKEAQKEKDTAKTYWKKVINSCQKTREQLYELVLENNWKGIEPLLEGLSSFLRLSEN